MRPIITATTDALTLPGIADRDAAAQAPPEQQEHDRWMSAWPAMSALEVRQPPQARPAGQMLRVSAWNLERCKHVEASAALLASRGVDLVLATEMDFGCARSGQRHTTAELAAALGLGYAFGVEFVELAIGDLRESEAHAGEINRHGLHGNAVLSRAPILRAALIPLDDGGAWYIGDLKQGQRRIGGRNAIATEIAAASGTVWAVSVHYESQSTPLTREAQTVRLLAGIAELAGGSPVVIGGDLNVFELSRAGLGPAEMLASPATVEPAFARFADAGFDWRQANIAGVTTRLHPWQSLEKQLLKIDWLFTRGLDATDPWIEPALGTDATVLSDHEAIGANVHSRGRLLT